ncbi:helix-turn-helix domain-containing protein [Staphylococcus hominis]
MTFGENLKAIRKRMKLTQQEMADRMDISRTYLSDLENTRRSTSINTVLYIAKRLDISVNELVNDSLELTEDEYNKKKFKFINNRINN